MDDGAGEKPLCVVLDTNQWRTHYGLRSHLGASLLYLVDVHDGVIGLPEVVRLEAEKHLAKAGRDAVAAVDEGLRKLQTLTGARPVIPLPTTDDLALAVEARFAELSHLLLPLEISGDQARRAVIRINASIPPSRSKESMKDSLLWEACKDLAQTYDVYLVSDDHGFFEPDHRRMAVEMHEECETEGMVIRLFRSLEAVLSELNESAPQLDYDYLARQILENLPKYAVDDWESRGFTLGAMYESQIQAFATEDVARLSLAFTIHTWLDDRQLDEHGNDRQGRLVLTGEATCAVANSAVTGVSLQTIEILHAAEDGSIERVRLLQIGSMIHLGKEPPMPLKIRAPLAARASTEGERT